MLKEELDASMAEVERTVARETKLSLEDYLRFQNMTMEDLREDFRPQAVARLRRALMLGEIVRLEGLEVDETEVSTQIEAASAPWGVRAEEVRASLSSDRGREAMQSRLLAGKAVERLVAIARGEAPELVSEEEEGEAEDVEAEGDVVND
jgi:trigger factor